MGYEKHGILLLEGNGTYNPDTRTIRYSSNSSLVHEIVHAIDHESAWELSKKYYEIIGVKMHPIKVRGIQRVYPPSEWECEFLAFYFECFLEIQDIFFDSASLKQAVKEADEFMNSVLF